MAGAYHSEEPPTQAGQGRRQPRPHPRPSLASATGCRRGRVLNRQRSDSRRPHRRLGACGLHGLGETSAKRMRPPCPRQGSSAKIGVALPLRPLTGRGNAALDEMVEPPTLAGRRLVGQAGGSRPVPCFRAGFCSKTIIPDSEEHPLASSTAVPKAVLRWIRAKQTEFITPPGPEYSRATCLSAKNGPGRRSTAAGVSTPTSFR